MYMYYTLQVKFLQVKSNNTKHRCTGVSHPVPTPQQLFTEYAHTHTHINNSRKKKEGSSNNKKKRKKTAAHTVDIFVLSRTDFLILREFV